MKTIRRGVFETNSSSTHSLSILSKDEFEKWRDGNYLLGNDDTIYSKEDAIEFVRNKYCEHGWNFIERNLTDMLSDYFTTFEDYGHNYEQFDRHYITENGDEIVVFGFFGYDY